MDNRYLWLQKCIIAACTHACEMGRRYLCLQSGSVVPELAKWIIGTCAAKWIIGMRTCAYVEADSILALLGAYVPVHT
jgi:hypothetical protein